MKHLLIIGCGDVAMRAIPLLTRRYRVFALVRNPAYREKLRALGVLPIFGDLDDRSSLARIAGLADAVLHFAPPANSGACDTRTRNLLSALSRGALPAQLIYIGSTGVYGDCGGAVVSESHPLHPQTARAQRRADAERQIRNWAKRNHVKACILRVPGIYAADRLPLDRLRQGLPCIIDSEDGYTSHIHADDLARIAAAALRYGKACRVYHASDDSQLKMGEYFDAVADASGLPHPPRVCRTRRASAAPAARLPRRGAARAAGNAAIVHERIAAAEQSAHEAGVESAAALSGGGGYAGYHQTSLNLLNAALRTKRASHCDGRRLLFGFLLFLVFSLLPFSHDHSPCVVACA